MELLSEILKFTLPSLIVGLTVYYLFNNFFAFQYRMKAVEHKQQEQHTTVPLRLQAYERLSLFSERISIPNLIMRLRTQESTSESLRYAMLIAVQQEFEHNVSQQIYISDELWQIIRLTKDNIMAIVNDTATKIDAKSDSEALVSALFKFLSENQSPTDMALSALRKEAGSLF